MRLNNDRRIVGQNSSGLNFSHCSILDYSRIELDPLTNYLNDPCLNKHMSDSLLRSSHRSAFEALIIKDARVF